MEHIGKYFVPKGDPDDFGESVKFIHTKYPGYRIIIEPRYPFRDAQGNARGVQNPKTALTVTFKGRIFETNSALVVETLRSGRVPGYIGKMGPEKIQDIITSGRRGGFFEVDKVEEAILLRRKELEEQARAEIEDRMREEIIAAEKPAPQVFVEEDLPADDEVVIFGRDPEPIQENPYLEEERAAIEQAVQRPVAGQVPILECTNCGTLCQSKFCPECGSSLVPRAKRVWTCDDCGEEFDSGFKLGQHRDGCPAIARTIIVPEEGKPMMGPAGTDTITPRGDRFKGLL